MDYFEFETLVEDEGNDKYLILIIYDISDNKHRLEISKLLEGYGTRIQKSAFEAWLTKKHFEIFPFVRSFMIDPPLSVIFHLHRSQLSFLH